MNARRERVRKRFDRAAATYDRYAFVQREAAEQLARRIAATCRPDDVGRAIEIGCGTGFLSRQLVATYPHTDWVISDVAPAMLAECRRRLEPLSSRISLRLLDGQAGGEEGAFDLVCSNLSFQWFDDLPATLRFWCERLNPEGVLIFNLPGHGSFRAWRESNRRNPDVPAPPQLPKADQLQQVLDAIAGPAGGTGEVFPSHHEEHVPGLRHFFGRLKQIGANTGLQIGAPNRSALRRWLRQNSDEPLTINYELLTAVYRKSDRREGDGNAG